MSKQKEKNPLAFRRRWLLHHKRDPSLETLTGKIMRKLPPLITYGMWMKIGVFGYFGARFLYILINACTQEHVLDYLYNELFQYKKIMIFLMVYYFFYRGFLQGRVPQMAEKRDKLLDFFTKHPYFDYNQVIFEEFQQEEQEEHQYSMKTTQQNGQPYVQPNDKSLFCYHPHGILTCGWIFNGSSHKRLRKGEIKWLIGDIFFQIPLVREFFLFFNALPANRPTMQHSMAKGQNLALLPGGYEEATIYERTKHRVYIKKRRGFIKMALQNGYKIFPAYIFGEEQTYSTFPYLLKCRLFLNRYKLPGVCFFGQWWCPFMPNPQVELITVIGKPLVLPLLLHPTKKQIEKYHQLYINSLQELFDRNKIKFAVDPESKLEIF